MRATKRDITYLQSFNKAFGDMPRKVSFSNFRKKLFDNMAKGLEIPVSVLTSKYESGYGQSPLTTILSELNKMQRYEEITRKCDLMTRIFFEDWFFGECANFESMTEEVEC